MSHSCKLKLGAIAAETFRLYAANWRPLLTLAAINALLSVPSELSRDQAFRLLVLLGTGLVSFWIGLAMIGATLQASGTATLPGALGIPRGKYLRAVTGMLLYTAVMVLPAVIAFALALPFALLKVTGVALAVPFVLVIGAALGFSVCAAIRLSLLIVLLVTEPEVAWLPVKRSWELMKHHAWPAVVIFAMLIVCWAPVVGLAMASQDIKGLSVHIVRWPWYWCSVVVGAITAPLFATAPVALYQAIRMEASE